MTGPISQRPTSESAGVAESSSPPSDSPRSRFGLIGFLVQRVFVYFALYTLSIGPMYWKWYGSQFVGGSSVIAAFYLPLATLADWIPPFGAWLNWYIRLWIG